MEDGKCKNLNRVKITGLVFRTVEHDETIANLATVPWQAVQQVGRVQLKPQCEQAIVALRPTADIHRVLFALQTPEHFLVRDGLLAKD